LWGQVYTFDYFSFSPISRPHWGQVYTFDYFSFSPIFRTLSFNSLSFSILPSSLRQARFTPDSVNP